MDGYVVNTTHTYFGKNYVRSILLLWTGGRQPTPLRRRRPSLEPTIAPSSSATPSLQQVQVQPEPSVHTVADSNWNRHRKRTLERRSGAGRKARGAGGVLQQLPHFLTGVKAWSSERSFHFLERVRDLFYVVRVFPLYCMCTTS